MTREEIYQLYNSLDRNRINSNPFEVTMNVIQRILSTMLKDEYTKIWVQASKSSIVKFCFTIFRNNNTYKMVFINMKNFRMIKFNDQPEKVDFEIKNIENIIDYIVSNGLLEYIVE